ncbi:hypothetical protein [Streptomyces antimycoticus]|uniref:hypothetical protein n=1 Tax=Streptomyces antimycoticus TaxID=68175 RepID=UPI0036CFB293
MADLVRHAVEGTTYDALTERGVDPKSGYRLPKSTLWRIANAQPVKINPALVRAVATAIDAPIRNVQLAAAQQYVGLVADDPLNASTEEAQVVIAHVPGMRAEDMPRAQEVLRQWVANERG